MTSLNLGNKMLMRNLFILNLLEGPWRVSVHQDLGLKLMEKLNVRLIFN